MRLGTTALKESRVPLMPYLRHKSTGVRRLTTQAKHRYLEYLSQPLDKERREEPFSRRASEVMPDQDNRRQMSIERAPADQRTLVNRSELGFQKGHFDLVMVEEKKTIHLRSNSVAHQPFRDRMPDVNTL